jgi:hypothetical protein
MVQLGIPLTFGWVLVIPLSIWSHDVAVDETFSWSPAQMLHLWFLLSLVVLAPVFWAADRRGWLDKLSRQSEHYPHVFWGGLVILWMMSTTASVRIAGLLEMEPLNFTSVLLHTPSYGFFYLAGFLVSRSAATRQALIRTKLWYIGIISWLAAVLFWVCFYEEISARGHFSIHLTNLVLVYAAAIGTTFAIFATALRVKTANCIASFFRDAAYTIYIVHLIPLGVSAHFMSKAGLVGGPLFASTATMAFAISFAFHHSVVRNSPLGAFLINGKTS